MSIRQLLARFAQLKVLERIFILIFFTAMLTTVFNYMPVIEEEVSSQNHSPSQSQKGKDADGSEPVTDDEAGGGKDLFSSPCELSVCHTELPDSRIRAVNDRYFPQQPGDCTPPPKLI